MSLILPRLVALASLAVGLSACATTGAPSRETTGGAWSSAPRAGGVRVVGGTARTVRAEDLRASRANRERVPVAPRPPVSPEPIRADADARITADLAVLTMPVEGFPRERLRDTFTADRDGGARLHNAIDLGAPTGTPVLAAAPGTVRKIHTSAKGGLSVYVLGRDGHTVFYYAHLSRYAPGLTEGQRVETGDRLGDVGATGNAQGPHLHFAIWRSTSGDAFWRGEPLNPYPYLRGAFPVAPPAVADAAPVPEARPVSGASARRAPVPAEVRPVPERRSGW